MKKNFCKKILPFVFIGIIMTGCTAKSSDNNVESTQIAQAEYTFTDDLGREVSVSSPKSVVTLIGSFTDIWLLSGGTVTGACDDSWASLNLDLPDNVINTGKVKEPNLESILSAEPDFIIGSVKTSSNLDLMETFESLGIPCAYFDVTGFDDYLDMLNICTDITGRKDLYKANGLDVQQQIANAVKKADGSSPEVLYLRTSASSVTAKGSEGNVCGEILSDLGCINIADGNAALSESLSLEAILQADPDYIFVTPQGTDKEAAIANIDHLFTSNPAWQSLSAVKNGNYYVLDPYLYNLKPNERWGEAYEKMADILYEK